MRGGRPNATGPFERAPADKTVKPTDSTDDPGPSEQATLVAELEALRRRNAELESRVASAPRRRPAINWRAVASATLVILGCVIVPLAGLSVWARNVVLDTERYVETVTPLASNRAITSAVSARVSARLIALLDADTRAREALPPRAQFLAAPLAIQVDGIVKSATDRVVASGQFREFWVRGNRLAHAQLAAVLTGRGSEFVMVGSGTVAIDLGAVVARVKQLLIAEGLGIAARIPAVDEQFVILQSPELARAQRAVDLLQTLAVVLPVLTGLLLLTGIALARSRMRALTRAAVGVALAATFLLAAIAIGRYFYLDAVDSVIVRPGVAEAFYDTMLRFLRSGARTLIIISLGVAVVAWFCGSAPGAVRLRRSVAAVGRGAARGIAEHGWLDDTEAWVATHRDVLRIAIAVLAVISLIAVGDRGLGSLLTLVIVAGVLFGAVEWLARRGEATQGEVTTTAPPPSSA